MNFVAGIWATSKPLHWTSTEVALVGSGLVFATALMSLMLGQLNQRRQSRSALAAEKLRIEASREIEERRISAAAEAETRRWLRNELREGLARVLAGVVCHLSHTSIIKYDLAFASCTE